jgi:hypothetical protein
MSVRNPEFVGLDPDHDGIILVRDFNGYEMRYRYSGGVMYPGRVWKSLTPDNKQQVTFFLPVPDGPPEVLAVETIDG